MAAAAVAANDRVTGQCAIHQVPTPTGSPMLSPSPLPFSAPLAQGLVSTVLIGGKPAAVVGSSGYNTPPHVGLHASDPFISPSVQVGRVVSGSATVLIGGKPAATVASQAACCGPTPGKLVPGNPRVLIG